MANFNATIDVNRFIDQCTSSIMWITKELGKKYEEERKAWKILMWMISVNPLSIEAEEKLGVLWTGKIRNQIVLPKTFGETYTIKLWSSTHRGLREINSSISGTDHIEQRCRAGYTILWTLIHAAEKQKGIDTVKYFCEYGIRAINEVHKSKNEELDLETLLGELNKWDHVCRVMSKMVESMRKDRHPWWGEKYPSTDKSKKEYVGACWALPMLNVKGSVSECDLVFDPCSLLRYNQSELLIPINKYTEWASTFLAVVAGFGWISNGLSDINMSKHWNMDPPPPNYITKYVLNSSKNIHTGLEATMIDVVNAKYWSKKQPLSKGSSNCISYVINMKDNPLLQTVKLNKTFEPKEFKIDFEFPAYVQDDTFFERMITLTALILSYGERTQWWINIGVNSPEIASKLATICIYMKKEIESPVEKCKEVLQKNTVLNVPVDSDDEYELMADISFILSMYSIISGAPEKYTLALKLSYLNEKIQKYKNNGDYYTQLHGPDLFCEQFISSTGPELMTNGINQINPKTLLWILGECIEKSQREYWNTTINNLFKELQSKNIPNNECIGCKFVKEDLWKPIKLKIILDTTCENCSIQIYHIKELFAIAWEKEIEKSCVDADEILNTGLLYIDELLDEISTFDILLKAPSKNCSRMWSCMLNSLRTSQLITNYLYPATSIEWLRFDAYRYKPQLLVKDNNEIYHNIPLISNIFRGQEKIMLVDEKMHEIQINGWVTIEFSEKLSRATNVLTEMYGPEYEDTTTHGLWEIVISITGSHSDGYVGRLVAFKLDQHIFEVYDHDIIYGTNCECQSNENEIPSITWETFQTSKPHKPFVFVKVHKGYIGHVTLGNERVYYKDDDECHKCALTQAKLSNSFIIAL